MSTTLGPLVDSGTPSAVLTPPLRRGAKAVVTSAERVLLVKERHSDGQPFWTLPGGGLRPHESLSDGLRRELSEELDCDALIGPALCGFWYAHRSAAPRVSVYTVFACHVLEDVKPVRREGIVDVRWVSPTDPPPATLLPVRAVLEEVDWFRRDIRYRRSVAQ